MELNEIMDELKPLSTEQLYATGNYDAMYLAGMIAEPKKMTGEDFDRWMEGGKELTMSAGWSCCEWLSGTRHIHLLLWTCEVPGTYRLSHYKHDL